jgi:hypothetical protein
VAVAVVDAVKVLDQQIAPAGLVAKERLHFLQRFRIDGAPLGNRADFGSHRERYYRPAPWTDS